MKRYIYAALLALGFLGTVTSCDDIFNETPKDKLSGEPILSDRLLLDEYVLPWYHNMSYGFYTFMPTNSLIKSLGREYLPWYGDQITVSNSTWFSTSYGDILKGNDQEITLRANQLWTSYYDQLRGINKLLGNADAISTSTKERVLGEAHFFRAYYYYMLMRRFGGVLLISKEYNTLNDSTRYPRASYQEMVDYIAREVDEAASRLPVTHESSEVGRITKGAALMLKAKTYMWAASPMFQNQQKSYLGFADDQSKALLRKAKATYDEIIAAGTYKLMDVPGTTQDEIKDNYRKIFLTKNSVESILEVQHNDDGNYSTEWGHRLDIYAAAPSFGGIDCAYVPTQNHVDEYGMRGGATYDKAHHPYDNRDYRFYANVLYDGSTYRGHVMDIHYTINNGMEEPGADLKRYGTSETASFTTTGYYMGKFVDPTTDLNYDATYASHQNYIIWRYAELLLDYAEIDLKLGNEADALQKVNMIRTRAHMEPLSAITWDSYVNERRVEMAFEETTYWDMLRWGVAVEKMNGGSNRLMGVKITRQSDGTSKYLYSQINRFPKRVRVYREKQNFWPIPWTEVRYQRIAQNPDWDEV